MRSVLRFKVHPSETQENYLLDFFEILQMDNLLNNFPVKYVPNIKCLVRVNYLPFALAPFVFQKEALFGLLCQHQDLCFGYLCFPTNQ